MQARLFRDGELLEETETTDLIVEVPPESASYRVEMEVDRRAHAQLSTVVSLAWEFVSETSSEGSVLPVSLIHFQPELNQNSAAELDTLFELPIKVLPQAESTASEARSLSVEVSYDDGTTWTEANVSGAGTDWVAELEHPAQSGYVSLRAAAIDADDNLVEVTIIRAYRVE